MIIFDDIFPWEGWGGELRLASGKCRLRIYDLEKGRANGLAHLRPFIVIASDVPESRMSVRSCTGHIATRVVEKFGIEPHRMLYMEYYPETVYGDRGQHVIPEKYDLVEFVWDKGKAIAPRWRTLRPPLLDMIKQVVRDAASPPSA